MDKLFFVKATQDEMYDRGNIMPVTHFLLYNQTQRVVVDITADIQQAPLLSRVPEMQVLPEQNAENIERLMAEGPKEPQKGLDVRPITYVKNFEYEELTGDQYEPIANAMVQLRDAKSSLDSVVASLRGDLISVGLVIPKPVKEEEERIEPVDPSSLDSETRQRLEAIVESVENSHSKSELYSKLGNHAKATEYSEEVVRERTAPSRNVVHTVEGLMYELDRAERLGIGDEERRNLAVRIYDLAHQRKQYDTELQMAEILQLPEGTIAFIKEEKLYSAMIGNYVIRGEVASSYMNIVKRASDGVLEERAQSIAKLAYEHLMQDKQGFGGSNYLHAGLLAKEYGLGRDNVLEAGRRLIEVQSSANYVDGYETVERAFTELELPVEMVHPIMLRFFERYLHMTDGTSQRIAERHPFTDDEISGVVNQAYTRFMKKGSFDFALRLRQVHPTLIQDRIPIEDLRTVVGVTHYQPRNASPTAL